MVYVLLCCGWREVGVFERGVEGGLAFIGCAFYAFENCFPGVEVVFVYRSEMEEGFVGVVCVFFEFAEEALGC
jgi:hypothetical protein